MLQVVCFLILVSPITNAQDCRTTSDSPSPNTPCVIPFKFQGKLRNRCITDADPNGKYWCSTKTDDNLEHIPGQGFWGYCEADSCPTVGETVKFVDPKERRK